MSTPVMSQRRTSVIAAILVALGPSSMSLYTPAMPTIVKAFETTPAVVKMTLTFYFIGFAFAQLAGGPVADAFGRRKAALWFLVIYVIGSVGAMLAPSVEILIAARLVQGIGASIGVTVSRAIVRDLYPGDTGARIMNLVAIMLASAPAFSPTIGGITMALAGWHAIFVLMAVFGIGAVAVVVIFMRETIEPDRANVRPAQIVRSYLTLLSNAEFVSAAFVITFSTGALYTLATVLPFVLIDEVGLTPTQFGLAMLLQSGVFFCGSIVLRFLLRWTTPRHTVRYGLMFILVGAVGFATLPGLFGPSVVTVMGPVAFYAFGIAFVMPYMMIAGLVPFPHIAGSASAMTGFFQMGSGLVGGTVAALIGAPVIAVSLIIPVMGVSCALSYAWYLSASGKARRREADAIAEQAVIEEAGFTQPAE